MPCRHRFYDILDPEREDIKFLFIGTFNPVWDADNGNNADYFYGRSTNLFWCICPHAFNDNCLIDKGPEEWKAFCKKHGIALTDVVREVTDAYENNPEHKKLITSFSDGNLDKKNEVGYIFELKFNTTRIKDLIEKNKESLKGVFLTRSSSNGIPRIWKEWKQIIEKCKELGIYSEALPTPSTKGGGIRDKIIKWHSTIEGKL